MVKTPWKYTVRHKKTHQNFFYRNLKKSYPILIIFGTHIYDTTGHQTAVQFPTSPNICFCTTWGKQNKQNITFLFNANYLIRIMHIWHIFFQISSTLAESLSNCLVVQLLTVNIRNIGHLMLSPFVDSSVDNVLLQTSTSRFLSSLIILNKVP